MNSKNLSILIVGAGAVGGITATLLKKAGHDVTIAVRSGAHAELAYQQGIEINGICGRHVVRMNAITSPEHCPSKMDLILLAVKNTDLETATKAYLPALKENGYLVTMQNGICEDRLVPLTGENKLIGCVTGWGATMENHGKLIMTSRGDFVIGYPGREADDFLAQTAAALSAVVPVKTTGNILGHKYAKLIINSCITSLGAVCGLYLGEMLSRKKVRNIFIAIIREAMAVADKSGIKVEVFGGKLDFTRFLSGNGRLSELRRHILIIIIGLKYRKLKSSSLQSLERGQRSEIDSLNGYIVAKGAAAGVPVPVNSTIVRIIHEIEEGKRKISYDNFSDASFSGFN